MIDSHFAIYIVPFQETILIAKYSIVAKGLKYIRFNLAYVNCKQYIDIVFPSIIANEFVYLLISSSYITFFQSSLYMLTKYFELN